MRFHVLMRPILTLLCIVQMPMREAKDDSDASWRHMQNADSKEKVLIVSNVSEGDPYHIRHKQEINSPVGCLPPACGRYVMLSDKILLTDTLVIKYAADGVGNKVGYA